MQSWTQMLPFWRKSSWQSLPPINSYCTPYLSRNSVSHSSIEVPGFPHVCVGKLPSLPSPYKGKACSWLSLLSGSFIEEGVPVWVFRAKGIAWAMFSPREGHSIRLATYSVFQYLLTQAFFTISPIPSAGCSPREDLEASRLYDRVAGAGLSPAADWSHGSSVPQNQAFGFKAGNSKRGTLSSWPTLTSHTELAADRPTWEGTLHLLSNSLQASCMHSLDGAPLVGWEGLRAGLEFGGLCFSPCTEEGLSDHLLKWTDFFPPFPITPHVWRSEPVL